MIYCIKCGTKNNPTETYCKKCGAPLAKSTKSWEKRIEEGAEDIGRRAEEWGDNLGKKAEKWGEEFEKYARQDCFGLAKDIAMLGILLGILIIIAGFLLLIGITLLRIIGAFFILSLGLIIFIIALKYVTKKDSDNK